MLYLAHYGVKGMKWGVRKKYVPHPRKSNGKTNARRIYENFKQKKANKSTQAVNPKPAKRSVRDMSDDELRSAINRMQMERTYAQLTAKEVSKGKKFVNEVVYGAAKSVAQEQVKELMKKAIKKASNSGSSSGGGP